MSDLEVVSLPNGQLSENCYLVADRRTREAVIIDPGEEPAMFLAEARHPRLDAARHLADPRARGPHPRCRGGEGSHAGCRSTSIRGDRRDLRCAAAVRRAGWGSQVEAPPPPDVELGPGTGSGSVAAAGVRGAASLRATRRAASASSGTGWCSAATCCSTARSAAPTCRAGTRDADVVDPLAIPLAPRFAPWCTAAMVPTPRSASSGSRIPSSPGACGRERTGLLSSRANARDLAGAFRKGEQDPSRALGRTARPASAADPRFPHARSGCKNPCPNCGTIYPLGDCSD